MQVNNNNLEKQLIKLKTKIDGYDKEYYDLYGTYKNLRLYYNDGYSESFFNLIEKEKNQVSSFLEELKQFYNILKEMNDNYSKYGNTIFIKEDSQKSLLKKHEIIKKISTDTNNIYTSIQTNKIEDIKIKEDILSINKELQQIEKTITNMQENYKKTYDNILNIEKKVGLNLSKLELTKVELNEFNKLPKSQSVLDRIGFFNGYDQKIKMLDSMKNEEQIYIDEIIEDIKEIASFYKSNNINKIKSLLNFISINFKTIHNNHINSINYLNNRVTEILQATSIIKKDIENIGGMKNAK